MISPGLNAQRSHDAILWLPCSSSKGVVYLMTSDMPGEERSGEGLNRMTRYARGEKVTLGGKVPPQFCPLVGTRGIPTLLMPVYLPTTVQSTTVQPTTGSLGTVPDSVLLRPLPVLTLLSWSRLVF